MGFFPGYSSGIFPSRFSRRNRRIRDGSGLPSKFAIPYTAKVGTVKKRESASRLKSTVFFKTAKKIPS